MLTTFVWSDYYIYLCTVKVELTRKSLGTHIPDIPLPRPLPATSTKLVGDHLFRPSVVETARYTPATDVSQGGTTGNGRTDSGCHVSGAYSEIPDSRCSVGGCQAALHPHRLNRQHGASEILPLTGKGDSRPLPPNFP